MTDASTTFMGPVGMLQTTGSSRVAREVSSSKPEAAHSNVVCSNSMTTPTIDSESESEYSSTADSRAAPAELVFSNRDSYTFMAIQFYIDHCSEGERMATFTVLNPRSKTERRIIPLAIGEGTLDLDDDQPPIFYRVEESDPLATDTKPDTFKTVYIRGRDRQQLFDFVNDALDAFDIARSESPRGMFSDRGMTSR